SSCATSADRAEEAAPDVLYRWRADEHPGPARGRVQPRLRHRARADAVEGAGGQQGDALSPGKDERPIQTYLAIYEVDSPDIVDSPAWKEAGERGDWAPKIR